MMNIALKTVFMLGFLGAAMSQKESDPLEGGRTAGEGDFTGWKLDVASLRRVPGAKDWYRFNMILGEVLKRACDFPFRTEDAMEEASTIFEEMVQLGLTDNAEAKAEFCKKLESMVEPAGPAKPMGILSNLARNQEFKSVKKGLRVSFADHSEVIKKVDENGNRVSIAVPIKQPSENKNVSKLNRFNVYVPRPEDYVDVDNKKGKVIGYAYGKPNVHGGFCEMDYVVKFGDGSTIHLPLTKYEIDMESIKIEKATHSAKKGDFQISITARDTWRPSRAPKNMTFSANLAVDRMEHAHFMFNSLKKECPGITDDTFQAFAEQVLHKGRKSVVIRRLNSMA